MNEIEDETFGLFDRMNNHEEESKLQTLKEKYLLAKQQLDELDSLNNTNQFKCTPITRDLIGFRRPLIYSPKPRDPIDSIQLQTCIKQIIERHGGGCNINTISAYIQQRWPRVFDDEGNLYSIFEYKKVVKDLLKGNQTIFQKSADLWTLLPNEIDVDNITDIEPLSEFICKTITENEGSCGFNFILKTVKQRWIVPIIRGVETTNEEINEFVTTTIETNPKFQYDPRNPNNYCLAGKIPTQPITPVQNSKKRNSESRDSSPDLLTSEIEEMISAPPSPEDGYVCSCGATTPGKTQIAKWRFDPATSSFKCISCFGKNRKYNPKEIFVKKKKEVDREQWIQCDRCHKWVSASSDNIIDLSVYDDTNPDHLDYFCPKCRQLNKDENRRPKRKVRTSRNSLKAN